MKNFKIKLGVLGLLLSFIYALSFTSCNENSISEIDTEISDASDENYFDNIKPLTLPKGYENNNELAANYLENASIEEFKKMEQSSLIQKFLIIEGLYDDIYSKLDYGDLLSEVINSYLSDAEITKLNQFLSEPSIESRSHCACQAFDYIANGWCDVRCRYKFNGECITDWYVWRCAWVNYCGPGC